MTTYREAGVDIEATDRLKEKIKELARRTFNRKVLTELGLFGGVYQVDKERVLIASVDGVGTKLKIAQLMKRHNTVGEDIVNHCVNDILCMGAEPLFFLDYIAYSKIEMDVLEEIVEGLSRACKNTRCPLIGGETAQLPGVYERGDYDLIGFIIGEVRKENIIDGSRIGEGDWLIGLSSSGLHTNGYSLARKVFFEKKGFKVDTYLPELGSTLGEELLKPHRSYLSIVKPVLKRLHGIAHITGGGFYGNVGRLLRKGLSCVIEKKSWEVPRVFRLIQEYGEVEEEEMYRVFNMGIGMILFVDNREAESVIKDIGEGVICGRVEKGDFGVRLV